MIGLILGTSEGRKILSLLNKYTSDIFVSTATNYGGELLQEFSFKSINTKPLNLEKLVDALKENSVEILVDASHPYAYDITENALKASSILGIKYVRYERPGVVDDFNGNIIKVTDYNELSEELDKIQGTILNTTGSKNLEKFKAMNLKNRIIHRVLPAVDVMEKCFSLGIKTENIIAVKGPLSYELNCSIIKEYNAEAIVLKDSGKAGGTEEKLRAAVNLGIKAFVIKRKEQKHNYIFCNEEQLVNYIINICK